jgi:hypothetical protein
MPTGMIDDATRHVDERAVDEEGLVQGGELGGAELGRLGEQVFADEVAVLYERVLQRVDDHPAAARSAARASRE